MTNSTMSEIDIRMADKSEIDWLAVLWHDGWQDAHARILPAELVRHRTLESFRHRLKAALPNLRVIGPIGAPLGLCLIEGDELNQLYVIDKARGTGVARQLLADGESRIRANGTTTAWLACAIGNERAARFYEKNGWRLARNEVIHLKTPAGAFPLEIWRYEKSL